MKLKIKKESLIVLLILFLVINLTIITVLILSFIEVKPKEIVQKRRAIYKDSDLFYDYEITRYPTMVEIIGITENKSKLVGVSVDTDIINFGILPVGRNNVQKTLILNKTSNKKTTVILKTLGNISEMISFNKNNFELIGDENVLIFLNASDHTIPGNYTGEIDIIIKIDTWLEE